ncbi:MAG: pyroglutamyl-peptidase I [Clostridia bacterium]|nr:pyroglutamyl-peptidase I [Clostridia bacterium]
MKEKILITCFEPFGGEEKNASMAMTDALPSVFSGIEAEKLTLPVEFARAAEIAEEKARAIGAKYVFCFGQAGARGAVTPELVAINLMHAAIPDNAGAKPQDKPIAAGGAAAYFTRFPARLIAEKIKAGGVPSSLSYSAGAYVCNDLYYRLLAAFEKSGVCVLFIHVPRESENLAAADMARAIAAALEEILAE